MSSAGAPPLAFPAYLMVRRMLCPGSLRSESGRRRAHLLEGCRPAPGYARLARLPSLHRVAGSAAAWIRRLPASRVEPQQRTSSGRVVIALAAGRWPRPTSWRATSMRAAKDEAGGTATSPIRGCFSRPGDQARRASQVGGAPLPRPYRRRPAPAPQTGSRRCAEPGSSPRTRRSSRLDPPWCNAP